MSDNRKTLEEMVKETEEVPMREAFQNLIEKYEDQVAEIGFLESIFSERPDRLKDEIFHEVCIILDGTSFDPHSLVDVRLWTTGSLARVLTETIWDSLNSGDLDGCLEEIERVLDEVEEILSSQNEDKQEAA